MAPVLKKPVGKLMKAIKRPAASPKQADDAAAGLAPKSPTAVLRKPAGFMKFREGEPQPSSEIAEAAMKLTAYDKRKFKADMSLAPDSIREEIDSLKNSGYGQGKTAKINMRIAAWKAGGWQNPFFQEILQWKESISRQNKNIAVPWQRMCKKVGGIENAKEMLQEFILHQNLINI